MCIIVDQNVISTEKLTQMALEKEQPLMFVTVFGCIMQLLSRYGEVFRALSRSIDGDKNVLLDVIEVL